MLDQPFPDRLGVVVALQIIALGLQIINLHVHGLIKHQTNDGGMLFVGAMSLATFSGTTIYGLFANWPINQIVGLTMTVAFFSAVVDVLNMMIRRKFDGNTMGAAAIYILAGALGVIALLQ